MTRLTSPIRAWADFHRMRPDGRIRISWRMIESVIEPYAPGNPVEVRDGEYVCLGRLVKGEATALEVQLDLDTFMPEMPLYETPEARQRYMHGIFPGGVRDRATPSQAGVRTEEEPVVVTGPGVVLRAGIPLVSV
ncbi:MAG: hypothetical protein DYH08_06330 [Actinobacteria bacterium ATB1]|nr:hypothetical protein [Actinobacteria bacterium ATB1]